jgi:flagellar motor switch protein FliN/FliY
MEGEQMEYEELSPSAEGNGGADLGRLQNVPVELAIEIGRTRMTIGEALALGPGSVVTVGRLAGDPVDLLVNGRVIARGEVVAIDEELGLRITEIAASVVDGGQDEGAAPGVLSQGEGGAAGEDVLGPPPPTPPPAGVASADGVGTGGGVSSGAAGASGLDAGNTDFNSSPLEGHI